ncbi:MAG: proton-conducting transporter membrane subunit, partial [Rhodospirillaceae bacterium]
VYLLLRYLYTVFGFEFAILQTAVPEVIVALSIAAILTASAIAIFQENVKRLLAYSSVAQMGYITLGLAIANENGLTGSLVHIFNHGIMKGALFMVLGCIALRAGGVSLDHLRGLGRRMPVTMTAFVIGGLSLIGVPGTVGFISKWYLVLAAVDAGMWPVAAVILAGSLLAVVYVWRLVEPIFFGTPDANAPAVQEAPLPMIAATWVLASACIVFGFATDFTAGTARAAAQMLLGTTP